MTDQISIVVGNSKLGSKIVNTSFTPIISCVSGVPCAKDNECYAIKSYRQYPNVRNAWDRNYRLYLKNPTNYFYQVETYLSEKSPMFFRWLVAGDIPDSRFLLGMVEMAVKFPATCFLSFTKNYGVFACVPKSDLPKNLNVIMSGWPNYPIPEYVRKNGYTIAWLGDDTDHRIPRNAILCEGSACKAKHKCSDCLICWNKRGTRDIILPKH